MRKIFNHFLIYFNVYAIILLVIYFIAYILLLKEPVLDKYGNIIRKDKIVRIGKEEFVKLSVYKDDIYQIHTNHDKEMKLKEKQMFQQFSNKSLLMQENYDNIIKQLKQQVTGQKYENIRLIELNERLFDDNVTNYNKYKNVVWELYEEREDCEDNTLECKEYKKYLKLFDDQMTEEEKKEQKNKEKEIAIKTFKKYVTWAYYVILFVLTLILTQNPPYYLLQKYIVSHTYSNSSAMHVTSISKYKQGILVAIQLVLYVILYSIPWFLFINFFSLNLIIGAFILISFNIIHLIFINKNKSHYVNYITSHVKYRKYVNKDKDKIMFLNPVYITMPPEIGVSFDSKCAYLISKFVRGIGRHEMSRVKQEILDISIDSISLVARQFVHVQSRNPVYILNDVQQTIKCNDINAFYNHHGLHQNVDLNMQMLITLQQRLQTYLKNKNDYMFVRTYLKMLGIIGHALQFIPQNRYNNYVVQFADNVLLKKRMTHQVLSEDLFYYYNLETHRFIRSYHYNITKRINMYYVPVSDNNALIQVYSASKEYLKQKNAKMKNVKMRVTGYNSKAIIAHLNKINSTIHYMSGDEHKSHDLSHWISKVLHITDINNMMDEITDEKILDVGSNLCDPVLGHGVYYNVSQEEEMDYKRMEDMASRLKSYVEYDKSRDANIVIYYGDVTTFDMTRTNVMKLYMHNCIYNIDLGRMLVNARYNDYSRIVTQTQFSQNVIEGVECENEINQMVYQFNECYNESTFSECNYQIEGITEGAVYTHNGATTMDWFKINSVDMGGEYWNKTIESADMGYYKQVWYPANSGKTGKEYLQENENSMDCIVIKNTQSYCSVYYTTRPKNASIRDLSIATREYSTQRMENNVGVLRNIVTGESEIESLTCNTWDEIADIDMTRNGIYYKIMRQGIVQNQVELHINIQPHHVWKHNITHFDRSVTLCFATIIESIVKSDYEMFGKHIRKCLNNNIQLYFKHNGYYYVIENNKYSYKKEILIIEKDKFHIGNIVDHIFDESEVRETTVEYIYNILCAVRMNDEDARYRDKYKCLDEIDSIVELKRKIDVGVISQVDKLEVMQEREVESVNINNVTVKKKQKIYNVTSNVNYSKTEDVQQALFGGSLKHSYITHFISVDLIQRTIYDPYNYLPQYLAFPRGAVPVVPRSLLIANSTYCVDCRNVIYQNINNNQEDLLFGVVNARFDNTFENGLLMVIDGDVIRYLHLEAIKNFRIDRSFNVTH